MALTTAQRTQEAAIYAAVLAALKAKYGATADATYGEIVEVEGWHHTLDDSGAVIDVVAHIIILQPPDASGERIRKRNQESVW
jgi:hypothetical protein